MCNTRYVQTYVHTYMCLYIYIYIHTYVCLYTYVYMYVCVYLYRLFVCACVCVCACMWVCAYVRDLSPLSLIIEYPNGILRYVILAIHTPRISESLDICAYITNEPDLGQWKSLSRSLSLSSSVSFSLPQFPPLTPLPHIFPPSCARASLSLPTGAARIFSGANKESLFNALLQTVNSLPQYEILFALQ